MYNMNFVRFQNLLIRLFYLNFIHELIIFSGFKLSCCDENQNNFENATESYFNNELLQNYTFGELFNQSFSSFNESDNSSTFMDERNVTEPDLVVTEDEGSFDKLDLNQKYLSFITSDEDICSCDLNSNYCDINCCCDADCSAEDMKVFSKCHSQAFVPDKNYCFQQDIIYRNNTPYKMIKDPESSLFCIVYDNLKEHLRFKELPVLKSHRDLDVLLKYQSKHISSWNEDQDNDESEWSNFKVGSPIRIETSDRKDQKVLKMWELPSGCFTRMCSCNQTIKYLENFVTFCSRKLPSIRDCQTDPALSSESYVKFCISSHSNPSDAMTGLSSLIAHTKANNVTNKSDQQCIQIPSETVMLKPKYSSSVCSNVVSAVHFTVLHNGLKGVDSISVKFNYINLTKDEVSFSQHFSVNFEWSNVNDSEKRSGNPGYQIGFPVLIGTNSSTTDIGEIFEITMQPGLSVLDRLADNRCSVERRLIKFGKNFKTSCLYKLVSKDCKNVQDEIFNILLGSSQKQVFVGVFGNANSSNFNDWIEAYHEDREVVQTEGTCNLIKGLSINIAYAAVGTVVNPQYKILGVGYHYAKPETIEFPCYPSCPHFTLSTSVSFFDVTEPALAHYPKVPTIKANLPSDFFYPFSYGKQANHVANMYLVFAMCILFLWE